jgi:hypothetical protein
MDLSAGARLVLSCARWFAGVDSVELLRQHASQVTDWRGMIATADAHAMTPTTAWCLRTNCADLVPPQILAELQKTLRSNAAHHMLLSGELLSLLRILDAEKVRAVPLKGPVLASELWGNIASRVMCDLDLLVSKADITRTTKILLANGYRLDSRLPPGQEKSAFHWNSQLAMVRDTPPVNLDLHWQLLPSLFPCAAYFDSVWDRLRTASFEGREILALSDNDLLLFLCAHGSRHLWKDLRLSADIARLVQIRQDLDWDSLMRSARDAGGELVLALGLWMVNRLIGVEFPSRVTDFVKIAMAGQTFAEQLEKNVLNESPPNDETLSSFGLQLKLASGLWPKLRCALGFSLLPTEADAESLPLPPALFFLYYPYRPIRLASKYGARLLGRLR